MLSLPIPDKASHIHYDAILPHGPLVPELTDDAVKLHYGAHLDPDLVAESYSRMGGWRPIFGQADNEQRGPNAKASVRRPILVLWLVPPGRAAGRYCFVRGAPDLHVVWGWLQIGSTLKIGMQPIPDGQATIRMLHTLKVGSSTPSTWAPTCSLGVVRMPAFRVPGRFAGTIIGSV